MLVQHVKLLGNTVFRNQMQAQSRCSKNKSPLFIGCEKWNSENSPLEEKQTWTENSKIQISLLGLVPLQWVSKIQYSETLHLEEASLETGRILIRQEAQENYQNLSPGTTLPAKEEQLTIQQLEPAGSFHKSAADGLIRCTATAGTSEPAPSLARTKDTPKTQKRASRLDPDIKHFTSKHYPGLSRAILRIPARC